MCRDLRVHVLRALNGCMIEQRICIHFLVQIYRVLPVTLLLQVLKIPRSYFQMLAGMDAENMSNGSRAVHPSSLFTSFPE